MTEDQNSTSGIFYGLSAFILWGLLPLYWKLLSHVDAVDLLAQRVVWSVVFMLCILAIKSHWRWIRRAIRDRVTLIRYTSAALLLGVNWGLYIWSVNNDFVIETSLGYYMTPLLTVVFGAIFLRERPRKYQWASVVIAAMGVAYLTYQYGRLPILGTTLGVTFAAYGVVKKKGTLNSLESMTFESFVLLPIALGYIIYLHMLGQGAFGQIDLRTDILLILTGLVTQIPLIFFSAAVQRLSITVLGVLNYVAPTTAFILGVWYFKEPFSNQELIGYLFIWCALILFTAEGIVTHQLKRSTKPPI